MTKELSPPRRTTPPRPAAVEIDDRAGTEAQGGVRVTCDVDDEWVRLTVEDSGIGIPPEFHERVFEPFFQVDVGFTRTTVGTGLGLAIAREAARAMGGDVTVVSAPGEGSRFTVSLPRAS